MARRTRHDRSRATGHTQENFNENFSPLPYTTVTRANTAVGLQPVSHNVLNSPQPDVNIKARRKRALSVDVCDIPTALTPAALANSAKRAERVSPSRARRLNSTREWVQSNRARAAEAWDADSRDLDEPAAEDGDVEIKEEWIDDEDMVGFVQKHSSASELSDSEVMIIEPTIGGSSQANNFTRFGISHASTVMPRPKSKVRVPTAEFSEPSPVTVNTRFTWPADTNLLFSRGTCKLSLNIQQPRIRDIIRDACDNVQACLLCRHAFPDAGLESSFVKDSIFAAARAHGPAAACICERLAHDEFYMSEMMSLPRARILSFRSKVKEHCKAIVAEAILAMSSRSEVVQFVEKQLSSFNYIFQTPNANGLGHVRRSRPYQNGRIIRVIRELYFARRRRSSLTACFDLFPKTQGDDGAINYEVPVPMVALVATGLYAALSEWQKGDRKRANFSTNACSKVYQAHIRNFNYIQKRRERGFHSMMAEIYTKASCPFGLGPDGNPIPHILHLNIDDLPE